MSPALVRRAASRVGGPARAALEALAEEMEADSRQTDPAPPPGSDSGFVFDAPLADERADTDEAVRRYEITSVEVPADPERAAAFRRDLERRGAVGTSTPCPGCPDCALYSDDAFRKGMG